MGYQSEADAQRAIVDALIWDGWLVLRINQGGATYVDDGFDAEKGKIKKRYIRFAHWQHLGLDQQDSGMSDVIAMKGRITVAVSDGDDVQFLKTPVEDSVLLAIEVKAPGRKRNVTDKQQAFLDAIEQHGGTAIVADCLEDVEPYLERMEPQ